jgi:putative DNA primase/helicase
MAETKSSMVLDGPTVARVTGEDKSSTRDMHGKAFEFSPKFKAVVYGNLPPKISGSASAIARRVLVIPLNCVFKGAVGSAGGSAPDLELMKKLEAEQGKILNWLIEGCLWWQKQGLRIPAIVAEASQKFVRDADIVATWKADRLVEDPAGKLFNGPAYEDYAPYARAQGREPGSAESFGHRLTELLGVETKPGKDDARKSVRFRAGWRLVSDRRTDPFTETAKPPTAPGTGPSPEIVH